MSAASKAVATYPETGTDLDLKHTARDPHLLDELQHELPWTKSFKATGHTVFADLCPLSNGQLLLGAAAPFKSKKQLLAPSLCLLDESGQLQKVRKYKKLKKDWDYIIDLVEDSITHTYKALLFNDKPLEYSDEDRDGKGIYAVATFDRKLKLKRLQPLQFNLQERYDAYTAWYVHAQLQPLANGGWQVVGQFRTNKDLDGTQEVVQCWQVMLKDE